MRLLVFLWLPYHALSKAISRKRWRMKSLPRHIKELRESGYTKIIFDCDGHTIVIQSHKHIEDNRA